MMLCFNENTDLHKTPETQFLTHMLLVKMVTYVFSQQNKYKLSDIKVISGWICIYECILNMLLFYVFKNQICPPTQAHFTPHNTAQNDPILQHWTAFNCTGINRI